MLARCFEMNLNNVTGISCKIKEADANARCKKVGEKGQKKEEEKLCRNQRSRSVWCLMFSSLFGESDWGKMQWLLSMQCRLQLRCS